MQTKLSKHIAALVRVNLDDLLLEAADPQDAVAHYLAEMDEGLAQAKDAVATAVAQEHHLKQRLMAARADSAEWDAKTDAALQTGDEEQARHALKRKLSHERVAKEIQEKLDRQKQVVAEMKASLSALQAKIEEAHHSGPGRVNKPRGGTP